MKLIPLSQGQFAKVSDKDYKKISEYKWHASWYKTNRCFYALTAVPYGDGSKRMRPLAMHRFIMGLGYGSKGVVDHRNHDTLDNTRRNLRVSTHVQNCQNRVLNKNNKSGLRGVSVHKQSGKWQATIGAYGKFTYLGLFDTKEEASARYKAEARKLFGRFSNV